MMSFEELEGLVTEAADTLRRLSISGYDLTGGGSSWPDPARHAAAEWLTYSNDIPRGRLSPPEAAAIDRMDIVLGWLSQLSRLHLLGVAWNRIIWARACGRSYQDIADMIAWKTRQKRSWSTVRRHYREAMGALLEIARSHG